MTDNISLAQVEAAQQAVYAHMRPTPLIRYPLLSQEMGLQAYIKHENHTPIGAFKIRGGLNLMAQLAQQGIPGVITVTRGNHGQSVALAAQLYGIPATVVVPVGNNPEKNALMRAQGAELIEYGKDFDEARTMAEQLQHERGLRYVHPANEPALVNGVGTYWLEVYKDLPDLDVAIVPVGGGQWGMCGDHRTQNLTTSGASDRRAGGKCPGGVSLLEESPFVRNRQCQHLCGWPGHAGGLCYAL